MVQEVNARALGRGLELLRANGGRFEINRLLFADDTALVADSEKNKLIVVIFWVASVNRWRFSMGCGTQNESGVYSVESSEKCAEQ